MISTVHIARSVQRLDLELRVIRHFLLDSTSRETRDAFVAAEARDYAEGMQRYLFGKPDRDSLDDLVAPAICRKYKDWLGCNMQHIVEFSENRLKQMEIILRYAQFESLFLKAVGNILWEYEPS